MKLISCKAFLCSNESVWLNSLVFSSRQDGRPAFNTSRWIKYFIRADKIGKIFCQNCAIKQKIGKEKALKDKSILTFLSAYFWHIDCKITSLKKGTRHYLVNRRLWKSWPFRGLWNGRSLVSFPRHLLSVKIAELFKKNLRKLTPWLPTEVWKRRR